MTVAVKARPSRISTYERLLRARQRQLQDRVRVRHEEVQVDQRVPEDELAEASRSVMQTAAVTTLERELHLLEEIEAALERIKEGSYGVCERCGKPIPERRLEALPWARLCLPCSELRESLGGQ